MSLILDLIHLFNGWCFFLSWDYSGRLTAFFLFTNLENKYFCLYQLEN